MILYSAKLAAKREFLLKSTHLENQRITNKDGLVTVAHTIMEDCLRGCEMDNKQYFDYLLDTFDEEHHLIRIVLIGEDNAVRLLVLDDDKWEKT